MSPTVSPTALAPDDVVETHEQGAANDRTPLLVLAPLREFRAGHDLAAPDDMADGRGV
jgi:hypothetical protein